MSFRYEIRLSGEGGQGLVLAGKVLAEAAAIYDDKNATQSQSYGPEARGGASRSEVIISDEDIDYRDGKLLVHVHNVGSLPAKNVAVEAYAGDPETGGQLIGRAVIDDIEAPNDLRPRIKTARIDWDLPKSGCDVHVLIDPNDSVKNEITTFNNHAHAKLPKKVTQPRQLIKPEEMNDSGGRGGRGRRRGR